MNEINPGVYDTVTLVNRTAKALKVTVDGRDIPLKPGKNYGIPRFVAPYAKAQNRVMGSTHPFNPTRFDSLIGVLADEGQPQKDPIDPLEQSDAIEVFDRSLIGGLADQATRIPGQPVTAWEATEGTRSMDGEQVAAR